MTSFWIIVAIAVIQFIVRGVAKAAETRKKQEQEAEARRATPPTSRAAPPSRASVRVSEPTATRSDRAIDAAERLADAMMQAAGVASEDMPRKTKAQAKPDLDELRRRRVEALRRRQQAVAPSTAASNRATPPSPPPAPPQPGSMMPVNPARAGRLQSGTSPVPAEVRGNASSKEKAARVPARVPGSVKTRGGSNRVGSRLQRRLRNPRAFREAFLLAELLQPPVSLRRGEAGLGG